MATFIPIYFALVGVSLDLVDAFDWRLTLGLLLVGTTVKFTATLIGARIAGEPPAMARVLATSVNARGGPGIVLATTAIAAGIIDARTFTALVVLALATSAGAGAWLGWTLRRNPATDALIRDVEAGDPASADMRPLPAVPRA
jgi:Kef-type K+ transport system membrane component KefB